MIPDRRIILAILVLLVLIVLPISFLVSYLDKGPQTTEFASITVDETEIFKAEISDKPLPEDLLKELMKVEKTWFDRVGLKHEYPKREET